MIDLDKMMAEATSKIKEVRSMEKMVFLTSCAFCISDISAIVDQGTDTLLVMKGGHKIPCNEAYKEVVKAVRNAQD